MLHLPMLCMPMSCKSILESFACEFIVIVSLPWERFQEINHMMTVHSTHGLFLTCTRESYMYLHNIQLINIYTMCMQLLLKPLTKVIGTPSYLEGQFLACGDESPSTLVSCLVTTAPPFGFCPFHPFPTPQPTLHYWQRWRQQSRSSSSGTVITIAGHR
jgi:hypothetical protein